MSRRITNPDASVLWYAAGEWSQFRFHEPAFYGQSYGSTLAGIPIALLHSVGLSYQTATPAVLGASMLVLWFALAIAAYHRGHSVAATAACAAPAVLSTYYAMYVTSVTFERTFVITGIGAAMLIGTRRTPIKFAAAIALLGIGMAIDISSGLLAVPVAAWSVLNERPTRTEIGAAVAGLAVAGVYTALGAGFYRFNPDHNLHGGLPLRPSVDIFRQSADHLDRLFRLFAPELVRGWWLPVGVGLAIGGGLLLTRRVRFVVPAVLVLGIVVAAMASPRAVDESGFFFPPGRLLLVFPPALWFLGLLLAEAFPSAARRMATLSMAVVLVVTGASVGIRSVNDSHDPSALYDAAIVAPLYGFTPVAVVDAQCADLERVAARGNAELFVLPAGGTLANGCGALRGNERRTLDVPFDRRTWVLEREASDRSRVVVFFPVEPSFCAIAAPRFQGCTRDGRAATLRFRPQPILNVLALLDMPVRPFGDGCIIEGFDCTAGHDARARFPINRGPVDAGSQLHAEINVALAAIRGGDMQFLEPGPDHAQTVSKVASALDNVDFHRTTMFRTGPMTVAIALTTPTRSGSERILGQLVKRPGRWMLAWSTQCAIATRNAIPCTPAVPQLFPGSVWRNLARSGH